MPGMRRLITTAVGDLQKRVETQAKSRAYASARAVPLRRRVDEALTDPRPSVPARDVFKRLRKHHAERVKAGRTKPGRADAVTPRQ